jgi:hypothetical protein
MKTLGECMIAAAMFMESEDVNILHEPMQDCETSISLIFESGEEYEFYIKVRKTNAAQN